MQTDDSVAIPRRRHSGSGFILIPAPQVYGKLPSSDSDHPPRPKSTPAHERLQQRQQTSSDTDTDMAQTENHSDQSAEQAVPSNTPPDIQPGSSNTPLARPTRPLPSTKSRKAATSRQTPLFSMPANPHMLPVQAQTTKNSVTENPRKLYVILEQACLEAYRVSSGGRTKNAREGDVKYALLNCDDHQGILAKTGRDIADARPDITHQVCSYPFLPYSLTNGS